MRLFLCMSLALPLLLLSVKYNGRRQWRKDKRTTTLFIQQCEKFYATARKSLNPWGYFYKFRKKFTTQRDRMRRRSIIACKIFSSNLPGSDHDYLGSTVLLFRWRTGGKQEVDQILSKCVYPNHSPPSPQVQFQNRFSLICPEWDTLAVLQAEVT